MDSNVLKLRHFRKSAELKATGHRFVGSQIIDPDDRTHWSPMIELAFVAMAETPVPLDEKKVDQARLELFQHLKRKYPFAKEFYFESESNLLDAEFED
jgi:hypothetical protein